MSTPTPIETRYAGCRFRSRLEARWAVFFDHLGVRWEYEIQGFLIGEHDRPYLPDFWLPVTGTWVEVKGSEGDFLANASLYAEAVGSSRRLPGIDSGREEAGLLVLGPVPRLGPTSYPMHTMLTYHPNDNGVFEIHADYLMFDVIDDAPMFLCPCSDTASQPPFLPDITPRTYTGGTVPDNYGRLDAKVAKAYGAARSARFEHGEKG